MVSKKVAKNLEQMYAKYAGKFSKQSASMQEIRLSKKQSMQINKNGTMQESLRKKQQGTR